MTRTLILLPAALFLALALSSCGGAGVPTSSLLSATSSKDAGPQDLSAEERMMLDATNAMRTQNQKCDGAVFKATTPLTWNGYLARSARAHTADMANQNYFDHVAPDGGTLATRDNAAGYTGWTTLGENIVAGDDVSGFVQRWMESPSHCKTLMDPKFRELGIGYVLKAGTTYRTYATQEFGTR
ncbi:CAP domain-containing protein [Deinococcus sp.]|uniref:CAP domain-containing protein n=1 Tax=Deinococcus sp. TaxID=47478 RepID=UPI0025F2DAC4|nr:CAP domain-containing protein [Deinococcus sp.]